MGILHTEKKYLPASLKLCVLWEMFAVVRRTAWFLSRLGTEMHVKGAKWRENPCHSKVLGSWWNYTLRYFSTDVPKMGSNYICAEIVSQARVRSLAGQSLPGPVSFVFLCWAGICRCRPEVGKSRRHLCLKLMLEQVTKGWMQEIYRSWDVGCFRRLQGQGMTGGERDICSKEAATI